MLLLLQSNYTLCRTFCDFRVPLLGVQPSIVYEVRIVTEVHGIFLRFEVIPATAGTITIIILSLYPFFVSLLV